MAIAHHALEQTMSDSDSSDELSFRHSQRGRPGLLRTTSASFEQIPGILHETTGAGAGMDVEKLHALIARLRSGPTSEDCHAAADVLTDYVTRLSAEG